MRKKRCCLQGDRSGLEVREPSQHFGFERVSFLPILTPHPTSLPALSPSSWGRHPLNHTMTAQGPLEAGRGKPVQNELQ